ncbi:energy-coupling factor ABC transporter permease [Salmonella enterica subsp. enterica serovar Kentucky]|nr:energy-coupling factor ABC transporter permease [Salmonella enterica subsp. enterica serovar Kentucky]
MAVIGPVVGYLVWKMACRAGLRRDVAVFLCAMLADLATYFVMYVVLPFAKAFTARPFLFFTWSGQ